MEVGAWFSNTRFRFANDNNFLQLFILIFFEKMFNSYSPNPPINYMFKVDAKDTTIYTLLT